jgi:hypothetical protein
MCCPTLAPIGKSKLRVFPRSQMLPKIARYEDTGNVADGTEI